MAAVGKVLFHVARPERISSPINLLVEVMSDSPAYDVSFNEEDELAVTKKAQCFWR
jgi:hypothetical protein